MELTLAKIGEITGAKLSASSNTYQALKLTGISPLVSAAEHDLSFFAPTSEKAHKELFELAVSTKAGALLVKEPNDAFPCPQLVHAEPMLAVMKLGALIKTKPSFNEGVHPSAIIDPSAEISSDVRIGAYSVVGPGVKIGPGCTVFPHVVIYQGAQIGAGSVIHSGAHIREEVILGENCIVQNGTVLGGDGFGYLPDQKGERHHIPHLGTVKLADRVEVGVNSAIDRGTLGNTEIGEATKIDNLVQVGHNITIGKRSVICGTVAMAGSSSVGDDTILGGNAGVADHVKIGSGVRAGGKAGITSDIPDGETVMGFPAVNYKLWKKQMLALRKLPELVKEVRRLKRD